MDICKTWSSFEVISVLITGSLYGDEFMFKGLYIVQIRLKCKCVFDKSARIVYRV